MDRVPSLETTEQLLAHTAWLTRVARALTKSSDDADDIVQETWLHALERPPAHGRNLRGWLGTLARNLARSKHRARATEIAHAPALPRPEAPRSPHDAVARAELQQLLLDSVLALAEPYRSTLVMRFLDELSAEQIAKQDAESVETVRTRIKRGLDQVRARVAQKLGAEREQLPALLAPLFTAGAVVVTSTAKVGLLIGAAAAVLATTLVFTRASHEGGARGDESTARSLAPAAAAAAKETGVAAAVATRVAEPAAERVAPKPVSATFDLVGTVVDSSGTPVADATVALFESESRRITDTNHFLLSCLVRPNGGASVADELRRTDASAQMVATDVHGEFALKGIARARRFRVGAFHATGGCSEVCEVAAPPDSDLRREQLSLLPGIVVHGRVVDADGHPAPGSSISINIQRRGGGLGSIMVDGPRTTGIIAGPDATFSLPPIPAETLDLQAANAEYTRRSEWMKVRADDGVAVHDITLRLGSAPFSVKLHGRVLGPDHQPLAATHPFLKSLAEWEKSSPFGQALYVWPIHGTVPRVGDVYPGPFVGGTKFIGKAGEYFCSAPLDEEFIPTCIAVIARDHVLAVEPLDEVSLLGADGDYEGPDLVVESPDGPLKATNAALLLKVVDAATQGPLTGTPTITYLLRTDGGGSGKMTNDGVRSDPQLIPPGRCAVIVSCRGYVSDWVAGDYAARAEPYVITLALRPAVRAVHGVVLDADQKPIAKALVSWLGEDGAQMRATALDPVTTDAEGRFEFEAVAATRGRLAVESDSFVPTFVDVAAGNEDALPRVELKRGVPVTFTCTPTADGRTPGGNLRILQGDDSIVREDWNAPFARPNLKWPRTLTLAPGKYRYRVEFLSRADDEGEFVAADGAQVVVTPHAR